MPRPKAFTTAAMTAATAEDSFTAGRDAAAAAAAAAPISAAAVQEQPGHQPIRITVQVEYDEHRELRQMCDRYADEIGVAQVAGAEVFRALLRIAQTDATVARKLGKELARTGGRRRRT